jgi:hypothetical protein
MNPILNYFHAERAESYLFIAVGIAATALAAWFWWGLKQPFFKGAAIPLVLIAAIQITVGTTIMLRTAQDITRVTAMAKNDKPRLQREELPRMQTVMKTFTQYRWLELTLLVLGAVMIALGTKHGMVAGAGWGLAAQCALMLLFDEVAEQRANTYVQWLVGST